MYAYDEQGRPTNVVTGVPGAGDEIAEPLHALGLSWSDASLRRSKSRADLNRTVERFHYDGAGHLESNEGDQIPAIAEANQDIVALTGLNPRTLEEWWTVNTVDELVKRDRLLEGRAETSPPIYNELHQLTEKAHRCQEKQS